MNVGSVNPGYFTTEGEAEPSAATAQSRDREARRLARERNSQDLDTGYMSTEGSGPESSPSTPISPAVAAAATALAAAAAASEPAANQFLFAFDDVDEMDHYDKDSHTLDKDDVKLCYTGGKNEDRALFIRRFVDMVAKVQRAHEARKRRHMRSAAFHALSQQAKKAFVDSKPDYRSLWDSLPSFLAGDDHSTSVAYDWWCAAYLKNGIMASHACHVLRDLTTRDAFQGSVRCAQPPFHELAPGATWAVCKVFEDGDADGEQSDEWESEGTSTKGLTGTDGTEDSHYCWALRAFIAELEAKFLMKGTKEKEDLLIAKSQTTEQDGLAYVKSCRRREAALNAGKMVEDPIVRQDIEECIKGLRIKEYRDRVSEQLRVSHPAPNKVTWEDLEVIVEVQDKLKNDAESWALTLQQELVRRLTCVYSCYEARQLGLDLAALVSAMRRSGSAPKTGDRRRDPRKKDSAQHGGDDAKKPPREVNNAERQKPTYGRVPPPDASKEFQCDRCFTRLPDPPERCYTGCRDARVPPNFHKDRQNSKWPNEVKNAQMRAYNIAHRFENNKMGITTKEPSDRDTSKGGQGKGAEAQAQSEDSDAETEYNSNFNQQAEYEESERDCLAGDGLEDSRDVGFSHAPDLQARAAVALGSTQKMQSFKVKTPEEFDKAAQVPKAVPPNVLSRKFHLLASNLRSSMRTCSQIAAILISQHAIDLPKDIENLLALEELMGNEPENATEQPTEVNEHELEDAHATVVQGVRERADSAEHQTDEEVPLDEMPDGVVDSAAARCAAAACVNDLGVVDFSDHGHVRAGTIKTRAYDALRAKMKQHLTDEQALLMTQVQPICKLQNATLYEGLALVSSGGELMLYRAILMDTGANCNIISIAVVRRLGFTVYEASTGAKVTRCDNSPTKFTHYCYVDVILAAGTPHMTLHRLHAFVTFEPENSWDLLIGTGPLKNSLMIDIKLGSGVAVSHAPTILGMDAQVVLPLVDMTPPRRPDLPRRVDPAVCLKSEIFGQGMECEWLKHSPLSTREERFAASGSRSEHIDDGYESPVGSPEPSPRHLAERPRPRAITRAELEARCRHRTCPLEGGRRSALASLAPAVQAASERMLEQFYEEPNPWEGGHARWFTENQDPAQDMPTKPSQDHVCVEFARCREQKWVTVDQLMSPSWLHVDQKLDHDVEKDRWMLDGDYMTHVPSSASKQDVVKPRERGRSRLDLNPIQKLQDKLQALFKYPSGEVTGTLMRDLKERVLCVQPSAATQYLDLMGCTLDHALVHNNGEELLDELQLPH
ncbi:hypothetical protein CYMTET_4920 [Cymbomonas tetramitiformis]|uniref:Uncharacterized protein n=1 Tax=Cymbomonas tetramitiformis TaxID=36881 RepID=A0AAE0H226_9CHLO|nr:hypothetical protein CYMTET_4920 [Cymbomonas tetramitiformis]